MPALKNMKDKFEFEINLKVEFVNWVNISELYTIKKRLRKKSI